MNCEVYAAMVLVFVMGYAAAWYQYNIPPVHVVVRPSSGAPMSTPVAPAGPGSERFYTPGDDGPLSEEPDQDHDNQVIGRLRR